MWLKACNNCPKFFHTATVVNIGHIFILALKDDDGNWMQIGKEIRDNLLNQFANLFKEYDVVRCFFWVP